MRIMDAYRDPVRENQVVILWDVAEGYFTGCYARLRDDDKAFLHRETINLGSSSETANAYKFEALDASNPGLDSKRLLQRGDYDGMKGRKFGGVFIVEDYVRRSDGEVTVRAKLRRWIPVSQVPFEPMPEPDLDDGYVGPLPTWPSGARGWD